MKQRCLVLVVTFLVSKGILFSQELYKAPAPSTQTRWVSPENPAAGKGLGGVANKGAKGSAFFTLKAGEKLVLADIKGAGIINRMWLSGTIPITEEQRRMIRIDMYWDGEEKPAVSAPIGDFFGIGLGLLVPFENALFSSPEGRSYNFTIPMPYRKSAKIILTNEGSSYALIWYDINYTMLDKLPSDAMYFHAYWNRIPKTDLGKDYTILPQVKGRGRFIGTNVGVIGDSLYRNTWFGEGEVKIYLDGDIKLPTLVGTGTEDYIGSGWGQGVYNNRNQGSLVSDSKNDLYAFYRYHIPDPVYFHEDCKVTLQQLGNTSIKNIREMRAKNADIELVWGFDSEDKNKKVPEQVLVLEQKDFPDINDKDFPTGISGGHFYRSDDVSSTAYFYLDKPSNNLPELPDTKLRMMDMKEKVWKMSRPKNNN